MRLFSLTAATAAALALMAGYAVAQDNAKCIVSGRDVAVTDKTPAVMINGQKAVFCCENCPKAFTADPEKFVKTAGNCPMNKNGAAKVSKESRVVLNNDLYYFCCANCPKGFSANPSRAVKELKDPVTGKTFAVTADSPRATQGTQIYLFADAESKAAFEKDPAKYVKAYK
jgi:YHS domain-containing protein